MKVLIATNNPHKFNKISEMLDSYKNIEILSTKDIAKIDVDENGKTFEENAVIKAREYSRQFDGLVIATDGGMDIPALPNWNQLFTKRFAGKNATDFDRIKTILEMMKNKTDAERIMTWNEAIALCRDGERLFSTIANGASGIMAQEFDETKYREGIWLCSIWNFPQFNGKNFFDLNKEEVAQVEISWQILGERLKSYLEDKLSECMS